MSENLASFTDDVAKHGRSLSVTFRTGLLLACLCATLTMHLQGQKTPLLIDGAYNPEMIPGWRVYSLLFRFISSHWIEKPDAILAYLQTIGLGSGESPTGDKAQKAQIDTLIATAQDFSRRATDLDSSVQETLKRNPSLVDSELQRLAQEKEHLTLEMVSILETRLGAVDAEKLRLHIENMKRKMKMVKTVP